MDRHSFRMFDMISGVIQNGQLEPGEEDSLRKLLIERSHDRKCVSLAEYIDRESKKAADRAADEIKARRDRLCRYCIRGSAIGEKCVSELKEDDIRKFIIQTAVLYEMDRKSWFVFLSMLQFALNAISCEGLLGFQHPEKMPEHFLDAVKRKRGIEKPFVGEEWERIRAWLEENPKDVRCLAIALWFEGGISMEEITGLKMADLLDYNGMYSTEPVVVKKNDSEDYLVLTPVRKQIIRAALSLYPGKDQEYIFMDMEKEGLVKLAKKSLQPKLAYICRQFGIVYKSYKCTDMILWGLGDGD